MLSVLIQVHKADILLKGDFKSCETMCAYSLSSSLLLVNFSTKSLFCSSTLLRSLKLIALFNCNETKFAMFFIVVNCSFLK